MFVILVFRKAMSKHSGGNEQWPHRPHWQCESWTIFCWVRNGWTKWWRYHFHSFCGGSTDVLPDMWVQDIWLTLIHSLVAARPEEDKVWDEIFPDQMHEVIWKQLGKPQGPESTEKRDPFDPIYLCKPLLLYFCGSGLHWFGLCYKEIMWAQW